MNRYDIIYEHQVNTKYSFWTFATERIEARGIVHAQTLARAHMRELKKANGNDFPMRVGKIKQVLENDC